MTEYELFISSHEDINFAPPSVPAEIIQNVRTIITTPRFSVPLFRTFGLSGDIVDSPIDSASAKLKSDIIMAVRKYEPRASVTHIECLPDEDGRLTVRIRIMI